MEKTKVIATFAEHYPTLRNDQKFRDYYIFAGQLVEEKGIYQLLDLFSRDGRLKLVVVGRYTKQLFDKYRNCRNIEFVGFCSREKTLSLMTSAAATIMPSLWYDVMPNVLIESFSVGTPVIAPKIGVFPELIGRGLGKIYPYGSSIALKKILLDYKKTAQIQTAVKKEYYSRYLPMHHYRQLISLYEKLL